MVRDRRFRISNDLALSSASLEKSDAKYNAEVLAEKIAAKQENRQAKPVSPFNIYAKPMNPEG